MQKKTVLILDSKYLILKIKPMKKPDLMLKTIITILLIGSVLSCSKNNLQGKAPRGYLNETFLKISYATKLLKLIDTEPAIPEELQVYEGLEYKTIDSISLQLNIYKQKKQTTKAPVLIFIHGGSWSKGNRADYLRYLVDYAQKG